MSFRFWCQNHILCSVITIPLKHSVERDWNIKSTMENCEKSFPWAQLHHNRLKLGHESVWGTQICSEEDTRHRCTLWSYSLLVLKVFSIALLNLQQALWEWSSPVQCCPVHSILRKHPHSIQKFILSEAARSRRQKLSKEGGHILDYAVHMASLWSLCRESHSRWIGGL